MIRAIRERIWLRPSKDISDSANCQCHQTPSGIRHPASAICLLPLRPPPTKPLSLPFFQLIFASVIIWVAP